MIKTDIIDGIGLLTLSRPEVHNAINRKMMEQIEAVLDQWKTDTTVKMLLIMGEGKHAFCSGGDIAEFHQLPHDKISEMLEHMKEVLHKLYTFPKPTIAALNGTAVGGGCEIATACDMRIAHASVKIGFIQITLGIATGWGGGTRLFHILPRSQALQLLLSGDKLRAQQAKEIGFIDEILPMDSFDQHVMRWCSRFSRHSLEALQAYKLTALEADSQALQIEDKLQLEVERNCKLWGSAAHQKAVETFLNRRKK